METPSRYNPQDFDVSGRFPQGILPQGQFFPDPLLTTQSSRNLPGFAQSGNYPFGETERLHLNDDPQTTFDMILKRASNTTKEKKRAILLDFEKYEKNQSSSIIRFLKEVPNEILDRVLDLRSIIFPYANLKGITEHFKSEATMEHDEPSKTDLLKAFIESLPHSREISDIIDALDLASPFPQQQKSPPYPDLLKNKPLDERRNPYNEALCATLEYYKDDKNYCKGLLNAISGASVESSIELGLISHPLEYRYPESTISESEDNPTMRYSRKIPAGKETLPPLLEEETRSRIKNGETVFSILPLLKWPDFSSNNANSSTINEGFSFPELTDIKIPILEISNWQHTVQIHNMIEDRNGDFLTITTDEIGSSQKTVFTNALSEEARKEIKESR